MSKESDGTNKVEGIRITAPSREGHRPKNLMLQKEANRKDDTECRQRRFVSGHYCRRARNNIWTLKMKDVRDRSEEYIWVFKSSCEKNADHTYITH